MASQRLSDIISLLLSFSEVPVLLGAAALIVAVVSYLAFAGPTPASTSSRKVQQAKAMREAYESMEKQSSRADRNRAKESSAGAASMQISQLWVYPVKSLRGCVVPQAMLTKEGFYHDRRFVLLQQDEANPGKWKHMAVSRISQMVLFHTSISGDIITITYRPPGSAADPETLEIPLEPENLQELKRVDVNMHFSPTTGFDMGEKYSKWFSDRFGFKVIIAYWGNNPRLVLGNLPNKPTSQGPKPKNVITKVISSLPVIGPMLEGDDGVIAFNDCAPYLVVTEQSLADVSKRLPEGVEADVTKFRANILLKSSDSAWAEDFWGELAFGDEGAKILLTGNCGRCKSLNVDYNTGESGTGKDGELLKLLQKDRRVDPGVKYSPIFGRYGFASKGSEGMVLRVGDEVALSKRNEERTRFCEYFLRAW
ncbi:MOSC N-terminal beta barrel domain containing protein [Hyaloscypha variabilis]